MTTVQRLPASLSSLDAALTALLRGLEPVAIVELPVRDALGCVLADMPELKAYPPYDIAQIDGWALRARDLVGASSYAPLPLAMPARWVEAGDPIPDGCDCVVDADSIDQSGPIPEVLTEVPPGHGVRRRGGDIPEGSGVAAGVPLRRLDLLLARAAGLERLRVRRPRLRVVNVPAASGATETAELIQGRALDAGADAVVAEAGSRDAAAIAAALDITACDLLVTVGGGGVGRTDATIRAIAQRGDALAHGFALRPGGTSAVARIENTPVVALSGSPAGALAAWWTLALPALDRLSGRQPRPTTVLPLRRKIASSVGIAEIALVARTDNSWVPLALGDLSLQAIMKADAWLAIPGESEGFAAGTAVGAYMLRP